jgi:hypothetical protein
MVPWYNYKVENEEVEKEMQNYEEQQTVFVVTYEDTTEDDGRDVRRFDSVHITHEHAEKHIEKWKIEHGEDEYTYKYSIREVFLDPKRL